MGGEKTRRLIPLGSATLTIVGSVIAFKLTQALSGSPSLPIVGAWMAAGIIVTYFLSRVQARSQEETPEAIKERVSQLATALREQVRIRSYGARRRLIVAPLRELDLDITPRTGWVRDRRFLIENVTSSVVVVVVSVYDPFHGKNYVLRDPVAQPSRSRGKLGSISRTSSSARTMRELPPPPKTAYTPGASSTTLCRRYES